MSTLRSRVVGVLRNRRLRTVALLVAGYKAYQAGQNYNILNKPFSAHRHRPGETVLDLNLDSVNVVTHDAPALFSSSEEMRLSRLIATLRAAKADPRVTGLVVHGLTGLSELGPAGLAELRAALADFSSGWGGKHTLLHLPAGLGAVGNGTLPLHFASVFDSVHVQPASPVIIPGLSLARLFFKRTLEKAGLKARTITRHEYKAVGNPFSEEGYTAPHAESVRAVLDAFMSEIVSTIASARSLPDSVVRTAIDDGILSAEDAAERGLVDPPLHRDELPAAMRARLQSNVDRRKAARPAAAAEWAAAMAHLRETWDAPNGPRDAWQDGALVSNLTNFGVAMQMAVHLTDKRSDVMWPAVEAQRRALRAHLAWLDTCPWEAEQLPPPDGAPVDLGAKAAMEAALPALLHSIPNVSSSLTVERRLTEQALEALELYPELVEGLRKKSKDASVLELDEENAKEVTRWCRSVWRALCLSARMVDTLSEAEEQLRRAGQSKASKGESDSDKEPNSDEEDEASEAFEPRPFLIGLLDEVEFREALAQDKSGELQQPGVANADAPTTDDTVVVKKQKSPAERRKLQYIRFADYSELVSTERRACAERASGGIVRFERVPRNNGGLPPNHKFTGVIDESEKNSLLRLQLAGHQLAPWRFSVPKGQYVAVISISGPITDDHSDATRAAIRRADKDPTIKAIVLRIDTPGGSVMASEEISRAVDVAKKPVVASMGNTCASGGYYVAAPCDRVFASPTTLTGSIGVIMQAFNSADLFERIGVTSDSVESGRFSKYFSAVAPVEEWSEDFAARIDKMIDESYERFVGIVARGRNLTFEKADSLARGRVWAGADAFKLGLVDELGGLDDAVRAAAELAHLAPDGEARAVDYPSMGMQVQEAARRRGLMPASLDEEGDEAPPGRRRRSRPMTAIFERIGVVDSESDDEGEDGEDEGHGESVEATVQMGGQIPYSGVGHLVFDRVVGSLDSYLLSASRESMAAGFVEAGLATALSALGGKSAAQAVMDEIKLADATGGRPAAVGPNIRVE